MKPDWATAAALALDWLVWTAFVFSVGMGNVLLMLLVLLTVGTVRVARHDWTLGRRPFDKIDAQ